MSKDLVALTRRELQNLAKEHNIKANLKSFEIIELLRQALAEKSSAITVESPSDSDGDSGDASPAPTAAAKAAESSIDSDSKDAKPAPKAAAALVTISPIVDKALA